uniref:Uncharacterized protein n=1 Tax=Macaca fascicularis TaxID=9541 RepID=I7GDJ8_MACFA|nr:unnamed protein product [Macaca fascicularis]
MPPALFFIKIIYSIWSLSWFYTNFRIFFYIYEKYYGIS